jgi:hypothetical protein
VRRPAAAAATVARTPGGASKARSFSAAEKCVGITFNTGLPVFRRTRSKSRLGVQRMAAAEKEEE